MSVRSLAQRRRHAPVEAFKDRAQPLRRPELKRVATAAPVLIPAAGLFLLINDFSWSLLGVELLLVPALVLLARRRAGVQLKRREKAGAFADRVYPPEGSGRDGPDIRHCAGCQDILVRAAERATDSPDAYSWPTDVAGWKRWARSRGGMFPPAEPGRKGSALVGRAAHLDTGHP